MVMVIVTLVAMVVMVVMVVMVGRSMKTCVLGSITSTTVESVGIHHPLARPIRPTHHSSPSLILIGRQAGDGSVCIHECQVCPHVGLQLWWTKEVVGVKALPA